MREQIEKLRNFLTDVNQELKRITWPVPREIAGATVVVMVAAALVALLLSIYDAVISLVLRVVLQ